MKYIDADRLRAEIEERKQIHFNDYFVKKSGNPADYGASNALAQVLSLIDSLQQEQPTVDLEKFISDFIDKKDSENQDKWCEEDIIEAMKSSFNLGLNARKEE